MNKKLSALSFQLAATVLCLCLSAIASAQVPGIINYQGRVTVAGTNFPGPTGQFKFALVNAAGTTNYWSNNGTATGEPSVAVSLAVSNGLYAVLLGDSPMGAIPAAVFTNADVRVRVWFNDGVSGFQQLTPDRRLGSVGYAMQAANVADGAITSTKILDGTVADADISASAAIADTKLSTISTAGKVADTALSANVSKLGPSIESGEITDGTIGTADIGTIDAGKIVGGDLTARRLKVGVNHTLTGDLATIAGGTNNTASAGYATVGGGVGNIASDDLATVGGGYYNTASAEATVGGGWYNTASGFNATISGGRSNTAGGYIGTVGGGYGNTASGNYATVGGGVVNTASGDVATVGGGFNNAASSYAATVGGGSNNLASGALSFVGGGGSNVASGVGATVGGGGYDGFNFAGNIASGRASVIGGGKQNRATTNDATVAGGVGNTASGIGAFVGGGGEYYGSGGVSGNTASGDLSVVGGGGYNIASGIAATIGGGAGNTASGSSATVGGGSDNTASNSFATVPGGYVNRAGGICSFAAGRQANAIHDGAFVWGDSTVAEIASTAANQFTARAAGGVRFFSNGGATLGAELAPNATSWTALSDRNVKENVEPISVRDVLAHLMQMPITKWSYKADPAQRRYIGPMAQDFHDAFGLGDDDKRINTLDADGVTLAAIQGLYAEMKEELTAKDERIAELERRLAELERKLIGGK